jgi:hypothetical protein
MVRMVGNLLIVRPLGVMVALVRRLRDLPSRLLRVPSTALSDDQVTMRQSPSDDEPEVGAEALDSRRENTEEARQLLDKIANRDEATDPEHRDEREAYRKAQLSVVEARRSAELHEGLLRIP